MTLASEEVTQVKSIDASTSVFVDCSISSIRSVVMPELEATLESVQSTLEINFLLKNFSEATLNIKR